MGVGRVWDEEKRKDTCQRRLLERQTPHHWTCSDAFHEMSSQPIKMCPHKTRTYPVRADARTSHCWTSKAPQSTIEEQAQTFSNLLGP